MSLTCNICLCDITSKPIKFCCRQYYHYDCISQWIKNKPSCPICRKDLNYNITKLFEEIDTKFEQISSSLRYVYTIPPPPPPHRHRSNNPFIMDIESVLPQQQQYVDHPRYRDNLFSQHDNFEVSLPPPNFNRLRRRRNAVVQSPRYILNTPFNIFSEINNVLNSSCTCSWTDNCTCGFRR